MKEFIAPQHSAFTEPVTTKKRKDWSLHYEDFLFGDIVPLNHKAGTPLYGTSFKVGDPVYLKEQNSIGFVMNGPLDAKDWQEWRSEVRTDVDGVQCIESLVPLTAAHLEIKGVHCPYTKYEDVMDFIRNIVPPEPKLIVVRFDETDHWAEDTQKKCKVIWGYYLVDLTQHVYQCSMTPDVQAYFLYNRFEFKEGVIPYGEEELSDMERDHGGSAYPTFGANTGWGKCYQVDTTGTEDFDAESWSAYMEKQIEAYQCNPIEFEFCDNLITL